MITSAARPTVWSELRVHVTTGPGIVRPWAYSMSCRAWSLYPSTTSTRWPNSAAIRACTRSSLLLNTGSSRSSRDAGELLSSAALPARPAPLATPSAGTAPASGDDACAAWPASAAPPAAASTPAPVPAAASAGGFSDSGALGASNAATALAAASTDRRRSSAGAPASSDPAAPGAARAAPRGRSAALLLSAPDSALENPGSRAPPGGLASGAAAPGEDAAPATGSGPTATFTSPPSFRVCRPSHRSGALAVVSVHLRGSQCLAAQLRGTCRVEVHEDRRDLPLRHVREDLLHLIVLQELEQARRVLRLHGAEDLRHPRDGCAGIRTARCGSRRLCHRARLSGRRIARAARCARPRRCPPIAARHDSDRGAVRGDRGDRRFRRSRAVGGENALRGQRDRGRIRQRDARAVRRQCVRLLGGSLPAD